MTTTIIEQTTVNGYAVTLARIDYGGARTDYVVNTAPVSQTGDPDAGSSASFGMMAAADHEYRETLRELTTEHDV